MSAFCRQNIKFSNFCLRKQFFEKKNQLRKSIFGFFKHNRNMGFGSYFDQKIFNFEVLWRLKNRKKTGLFVNYTHITVRLILYLGITTRLLRYYTLNSVKQLFRKLFFSSLKMPLRPNRPNSAVNSPKF